MGFLRAIVAVSVATVIMLSGYEILFLAPSFTRLIKENTEKEAIRIANHLSETFLLREGKAISRQTLTEEFLSLLAVADRSFGLMKVKLFSPAGEVVYSTDPQDIGVINRNVYFVEQVARGRTYVKVVQKDRKSAEQQVVGVDVVETYIPVMKEETFLGAFELYLDITAEKTQLDRLVTRSYAILLMLAFGLLMVVIFISLRARRSIIERQRAEERIIEQSADLLEKNSELSVLNEISTVISQSINMTELLPMALQTVVNRLQLFQIQNKAGIFLVNGEKMKLVAHLGHPEVFLKMHDNMTVYDCLCGLAARTGEIIISTNSSNDSRHSFCYSGMLPHGHIIVPLKAAGVVVGVLYLYVPADAEVSPHIRELLISIGNQLGVALDNARLYDETKRLSLHDPLTGLANRRFMTTTLDQAVEMAERYGRPLAVAMMDIDYFKKYNDTHGHAAGDALLIKITGIISTSLRKSDFPCRYGGEEFLVMMPETDALTACVVMKRLRTIIESETGVTISAGVYNYKKDMTVEKLIKAADDALYRAKEKGRNRVECEEPLQNLTIGNRYGGD